MRTLGGRRIELWVEPRDGAAAINPVMAALLESISSAGASNAVRVPEHELVDVDRVDARRPDLVLLKSVTAVALSLAVANETGGGRFLNAAAATRSAHDKAHSIAALAAAGLPVPRTLLAAGDAVLASPAHEPGNWVSKPVHGIHGRGVMMHDRFPTKLDTGSVPGEPERGPSYVVDDGVQLLQPFIGDGPDTKVYVADGQRFVARKQFGPNSYSSDEIEPASLDDDETEVVLAVGDALDLRCYGVDLRRHDDVPVIVDANAFPGFRGFPEAVPALVAEIERALRAAP